MRKILGFVFCFLLCQLTFVCFPQITSSFYLLRWIIFYLLMFLSVGTLLFGNRIKSKKLVIAVLIACFFNEVGVLLNHVTRNEWIVTIYYLLVSVLYAMLFFLNKNQIFKRKNYKRFFEKKSILGFAVTFLLNFYLIKASNQIQIESNLHFENDLLYHLNIMAARHLVSSGFLLPQFIFFSWASDSLYQQQVDMQ